MEGEPQPKMSQNDMINCILNEVFYNGRRRKDLTLRTLKRINELIPFLDEANALFIEAIRDPETGFGGLLEAERKGCCHPMLYCILADCYRNYYDRPSTVMEYANQVIKSML